MKSKLVLLAVLAALSVNAQAANEVSNNCPGNSCHNDSSATGGNAAATSNAQAAAIAGALAVGTGIGGAATGGAGGNGAATATGEGGKGGNVKADIAIGGDKFDAARIPVSTAYANAPLPSATCRTGGAIGVQVMGFGGSFGGDRAVDTCEINEAARIAAAIGKVDMATEIFCQNKWAKKTTECQAIAVEE